MCLCPYITTGRLINCDNVDGTEITSLKCLKKALRKIHPPPHENDEFYVLRNYQVDDGKATVCELNSSRNLEHFYRLIGSLILQEKLLGSKF
nr:hypothetical protein HmN_000492800 [Hymenolepis microstoma]